MPQTKETQSSADKNTAESSKKKQQVPAVSSSKTNSAAKGSSKVSDVTGLATATKTSAINSPAETVRITAENDITGKTEVREHRYYYWVSKRRLRCSRTFSYICLLGLLAISYRRFIAIRSKFKLSTYVQEMLVVGRRGCVQRLNYFIIIIIIIVIVLCCS